MRKAAESNEKGSIVQNWLFVDFVQELIAGFLLVILF